MGCGSSKPVAPYEATAARVSKDDVTAAEATYCWVCKPGSKEWQGEWRSGTSKDAPKEMGAESMLYSLVNIDAPAAAPASEGVDMKELVSVAGEMASSAYFAAVPSRRPFRELRGGGGACTAQPSCARC